VSVSFLIAPIILILLQPDAGSALVFLSFFILLFREGFPANYYILAISGITLLLLGFLFPTPVLVIALIALGMLPFLLGHERKAPWLGGWAVLLAVVWFFFREENQWYFLGALGGILLALAGVHLARKDPRLVVLV
ncbi:hypothetical protein RZS08_27260, partial [Arthrospira platensis SPKY1]|nr:hypothetical protein [Arthrospira platensis SPKY1]